MRTFRRIRRILAASLLVVHQACCYHYVAAPGTPPDYIVAHKPRQVRVTLTDGTSRTLLKPTVAQDSLKGYLAAPRTGGGTRPGAPWATPLTSVRGLEVASVSSAATAGVAVGVVLLLGAVAALVAADANCWSVWGCS